jgi:Domain of unknown function (DUF4304)
MEEKLNELITTLITPFLKSHGFKKQKHYFHKTDRYFTFSINFPVDREYTENGAFVWLICGIYSAEFEGMMGRGIKSKPIGYDNIFSHNYSTITGKDDDRFLIEKTSDLDILGKEMIDILEKIMAFFSTINSLDGLMNHCLEHNYLVHHEDQLRYLAMIKDEEKSGKYLGKIKEKLYQISEKAYSVYAQKLEKFKAEYEPSSSKDSMVSSN